MSQFTVPQSSDPLVPRDFNEWTLNIYGIFKRSGSRIAAMAAVWAVIPVIGGVWTSGGLLEYSERFNTILPAGQTTVTPEQSDRFWDAFAELMGFAALTMLVSLVLAYFTAAGWAAATRLAVTDAAGRPMAFGEALAYGARKGLTLWGWYLLVAVCVFVGTCLCVLPGLYLAVAFALIAPVTILEGGGAAMARSFRLVHARFGKMLGRIVLSFVGAFVVGLVLYTIQALLAGAGLGSSGLGGSSPLDLVVDGVFAMISAIVTAVILVSALLVTYADARGAEDPSATTSAMLERSPA